MKYIHCIECNQKKPTNEVFIYEEKNYCHECLSKKNKDESISEADIERLVDDTICTNCHYDNGDFDLKKISNFPLCEKCFSLIMNRPFPKWIKISSVALILIVLFGLFYNSKYLFSYLDIRESNKLFQTGKLEESYLKMEEASRKLPHLEYLTGLSNLYEGIYLFYNNKLKEALLLFESYKEYFPDDNDIEYWILNSKSGISFDSKDYQNFYNYQKELFNLNPEDIIYIAGVSSGASCLYIITNDEKYKNEMNEYFELATQKMLPEEKEILSEYIQRIKYRIFSGEIISSEEYYEKYPEGWKGDIK